MGLPKKKGLAMQGAATDRAAHQLVMWTKGFENIAEAASAIGFGVFALLAVISQLILPSFSLLELTAAGWIKLKTVYADIPCPSLNWRVYSTLGFLLVYAVIGLLVAIESFLFGRVVTTVFAELVSKQRRLAGGHFPYDSEDEYNEDLDRTVRQVKLEDRWLMRHLRENAGHKEVN